MKTILFYLLQVVIASGILYGYYHFFLRNKKFHHYNRFYLLTATVISILVPFLNIPVYFTHEEARSSVIFQGLTEIYTSGTVVSSHSNTSANFSWQQLLYLVYGLIGLIILVRIIVSLRKIFLITRHNKIERLNDIHFVNTDEPGTPFSFFTWLFWNKNIELHSSKGEQIFKHELFHIQQKHSVDTIYLELLNTFFWINPFFHIIKKEIKAIHEFLADQYAANPNEKWEYAELLLMQAFQTQHSLVNPFFHNQIKRRITMITTSKKPGYQYLRKTMALPLAVIIFALFAFTYKTKDNFLKLAEAHPSIFNLLPTTNQTETKNFKDTLPKKSIVIFYSKQDHVTISADKVVYIPSETQNNIDLASALIILNGDRKKVAELNGMRVTAKQVIIYSKNDLEAVNKFGKDAANGVMVFDDATISKEVIADKQKPMNGILVFVDGQAKGVYKDLQSIPDITIAPESIKSVNVIKDSIALLPFGEKGKNGVLQIFTKPVPVISEVTVTDVKDVNAPQEVQVGDVNVIKIENVKAISKPSTSVIKPNLGTSIKQDTTITLVQASQANATHNVVTVVGKKIDVGMEKQKLVEQKTAARTNNGGANLVFSKVEINPAFPGGQDAWMKFIMTNCRVSTPVDKGAPAGKYTVYLQFIVGADGTISDIKAVTHEGYGMEEEAIRLMKTSPNWIAAVQNGKSVSAYVKQPLTFVVEEESPVKKDQP